MGSSFQAAKNGSSKKSLSLTASPPAPVSTPAPTPTPASTNAKVSFGLVQANVCDMNELGEIHVKNWADGMGDASSLSTYVASAAACNKVQTPLFTVNWDRKTTQQIQSALTPYFALNKNTPVWEFGLEENIGGGEGCCSVAQLQRLNDKLQAVVSARTAAGNTTAKITYQVVGTLANTSYPDLLNSAAAAKIDVLSAHPYAWPDFATPETWHDQWIDQVKALIANSPTANKKMQIMYTEVGAPVFGVDAPGDRAQSLLENAAYLVKLHVMAFRKGVRRLYWYHGQDSCSDPNHAECAFGLVATDGTKRPSYYAFRTMVSCLKDKDLVPQYTELSSGVRIYDFSGASGHCLVVWSYKDGITERLAPSKPVVGVPLSALTAHSVLSVQSVVGQAVAFQAGASLSISPTPIFISTGN